LSGTVIFWLGIGTLGYQIWSWFRNGIWTPLEFRLAWQSVIGYEPQFIWSGVERAFTEVLEWPLSGTLVLLGIFIEMIGRIVDEMLGKVYELGKKLASRLLGRAIFP
jgi:hypothetical protein